MTDIPTGPQPSLGKVEGLVLVPHPDFPSSTPWSITVDAGRTPEGDFVLRYLVEGEIDHLVLPLAEGYSVRRDNLWQTTCFEAFVGRRDVSEYLEFNFAPSTSWAAYRFTGYRADRDPLPFSRPHFDVERDAEKLEFTVALDATAVSELPDDETWIVGLTAVIEDIDGSKSYWALAHAAGPPDFHNRDCFTARLAAPSAA